MNTPTGVNERHMDSLDREAREQRAASELATLESAGPAGSLSTGDFSVLLAMKFSKLLPELRGTADFKPERPQWELSFQCPLCQHRTGIRVSGNPPSHPIWQIRPAPLAMLDSITADELVTVQWARIWDSATIEPSMQNLPHPRQVTCAAHFSVTSGNITLH